MKFKKAFCYVGIAMIIIGLTACGNTKELNEVPSNIVENDESKDVTVNLGNDTVKKEMSEEKTISGNDNQPIESNVDVPSNIILYYGYEFVAEPSYQSIGDMELSDSSIKKYNTTYYNYKNGKYEGPTKGTFGEETYEGASVVEGVGKIAMTKKYDAVPRSYTKLETLPKELNELMDWSHYEIRSIDLDGDGKQEYFVSYAADYAEDQIGDGKAVASSYIMLLDSNYKKITDIVSLENGFEANRKDSKHFVSLDDLEYIDIDEDGVMEIILDVPVYPYYQGEVINILKYSNGKIEGKTNIQATLLP